MTPSRVKKTKNKTKKKPKRKNIFRTPNPETILFLCDMVYKLEYMVHLLRQRVEVLEGQVQELLSKERLR